MCQSQNAKRTECATCAPIARESSAPVTHEHKFSRLSNLPYELQSHICSFLSVGDVQALRRVNHHYRSLISLEFMRECYSPAQFNQHFISVCGSCLCYHGDPKKLFWANEDSMQTPLAARCGPCAVQRREFLVPGERLEAKARKEQHRRSAAPYLICTSCRWCSFPVWEGAQYHPDCFKRFQQVIYVHCATLLFRSTVAIASYSLAWKYLYDHRVVLIPTVVSTAQRASVRRDN
jgi:hypothetical protein